MVIDSEVGERDEGIFYLLPSEMSKSGLLNPEKLLHAKLLIGINQKKKIELPFIPELDDYNLFKYFKTEDELNDEFNTHEKKNKMF